MGKTSGREFRPITYYSKENKEFLLINILLVDDHEIVRAALSKILGDVKDFHIIAETNNGEEAIQMVKKTQPNIDIVLMDIKMPRMSGLEAIKKILRYDHNIKILMVTAMSNVLIATQALKAGAFGYLTKDTSLEETIRAIRAAYVGQRYVSPALAEQLAFKHTDHEKSPFELLSQRELEILMKIAHGMKLTQIGEDMNLSTKTVSSYHHLILKKLNVRNDVELTILAIQQGIVESPDINSN
jgi:two-component system, NarL family, invasion response regulator UvrY